jgi:hypothetical protein
MMIMTSRPSGAARRLSGLARLLAGRNQLRRSYDRIEGAVLVALSAVFLVVVAGASVLGGHIYYSQQADAAGLHVSVATLTQPGPTVAGPVEPVRARARWPASGGRERPGVLTSVTAPDILGAPAGTRVPVWLNRSGQPAVLPPGQTLMIFNALLAADSAAAGAAVALLLSYGLCRLALDRRRLAAWESAWALTGPRWTAHR